MFQAKILIDNTKLINFEDYEVRQNGFYWKYFSNKVVNAISLMKIKRKLERKNP